jgi:hypothetical protein
MTEEIARIEAALRRLGEDATPPDGWERRVLARVAERRPRRGWWTVPALALASAVMLAAPPARPHELELAVAREAHGPTMRGSDTRGDSAHVGDHLIATATGGAGTPAIWIYRNEHELVARCPGGPSCAARGLAANLELTSLGLYTIVALSSPTPLPEPHGSYDADLAAAGAAGATIRTREFDVR